MEASNPPDVNTKKKGKGKNGPSNKGESHTGESHNDESHNGESQPGESQSTQKRKLPGNQTHSKSGSTSDGGGRESKTKKKKKSSDSGAAKEPTMFNGDANGSGEAGNPAPSGDAESEDESPAHCNLEDQPVTPKHRLRFNSGVNAKSSPLLSSNAKRRPQPSFDLTIPSEAKAEFMIRWNAGEVKDGIDSEVITWLRVAGGDQARARQLLQSQTIEYGVSSELLRESHLSLPEVLKWAKTKDIDLIETFLEDCISQAKVATRPYLCLIVYFDAFF